MIYLPSHMEQQPKLRRQGRDSRPAAAGSFWTLGGSQPGCARVCASDRFGGLQCGQCADTVGELRTIVTTGEGGWRAEVCSQLPAICGSVGRWVRWRETASCKPRSQPPRAAAANGARVGGRGAVGKLKIRFTDLRPELPAHHDARRQEQLLRVCANRAQPRERTASAAWLARPAEQGAAGAVLHGRRVVSPAGGCSIVLGARRRRRSLHRPLCITCAAALCGAGGHSEPAHGALVSSGADSSCSQLAATSDVGMATA